MRTKKLNNTIAMLRDYKENEGLTYEELSKQTNFSVVTLNKWLTGKAIPIDASVEAVQNFLNTVYARQFVEIAEADKTYIDSRLVAQWTGKTHKNLLQDIRGYIADLEHEQVKLTGLKSQPCEEPRNINVFKTEYYFIASTYTHPLTKQEQPCYLITQKGCELIAHKMTGVKGTIFTVSYINEFHRLKDNEQVQQTPQIESEKCLNYEVLEGMTREEKDLKYIKNRLMEVAKNADLNTVTHELVLIAKIVGIMLDED
ncbi:Rha family transcriptional regulator [Lactobacillus sp. AN1001]